MKKTLISILAMMLLLALAVGAMAEATVYITKNNVKIYKSADTKSKKVATLDGNDKAKRVDEIGGWSQISFGKKKGWVQNKYLSEDPVPSRCKHKWGKWEIVNKPTCTKTGYKVRYCKKCGIMGEKDIPKTEHTYGKWKVKKEATCTKTGEKTRKCKVCGKVQTKEIKKAPHEYGKWVVTVEPTCTETGEHYRKCKVCGHKDVQTMKKTPHPYGEWIVTDAPTCTETGVRYRVCEVCGHQQTQEMAMLPHDYKWEIVVEATDHTSGVRAQVCQVCGHREADQDYDPEGTLRRGDKGDKVREIQQLLVDQGYLDASGADGSFGGGTEKAIMKFQKDCGFNPDGVAWPQTIKRLVHEFGPWTIVKQATRTEAGERSRVCEECGYTQTETVEAGESYARKDRGEAIRAMQQILKALGYEVGSVDGIYGGKLDSAFTAFAADNGVDFQAGKVRPADVDALVSAWLKKIPAEQWTEDGESDNAVDLALSITPAGEDDGVRTFNWTLANIGTQGAKFNALLLAYGEEPDFKGDVLVMALDDAELQADLRNELSGSFTVADGWGEGELHFAAVATSEKTGEKWLSNVLTIDEELSEAA